MNLRCITGFPLLASGLVLLGLVPSASASLTTYTSFTGNVGVSVNGGGSTASTLPNGLTSEVPAGSTVLAAYLYTSTYDLNLGAAGATVAQASAGGTLNGSTVTYTALPTNASSALPLQAGRANVTSIVAAAINPGGVAATGGVYNFSVTETDTALQDGEVLVVVYSDASLPTSSIGILDGSASSTGDTSSINFASSPVGSTVYMSLGDGFSYDAAGDNSQTSTINVDGSLLTSAAGNCDSSQDASCANGNLITAGKLGLNANGSVNTAYSNGFTPVGDTNSGTDHELYNLSSLITPAYGNTITLTTANTSLDDNIFLEVFDASGLAGFNAPPPTMGVTPEPGTITLLGTGMACMGLLFWSRRKQGLDFNQG